jgi:class 3 adenylate cyclase
MSNPAGPTAQEDGPTPAVAPGDERRRRVRLANIRQELLAPVTAIVGYAEMARDEARRIGLQPLLADLERIQLAARALAELVEGLLDSGRGVENAAGAGATEEKLRHDLRNPLNVLKGYGEMVLEDLDGLGGTALHADLQRLLAEVAHLLGNLDAVVSFSSRDVGAADMPGDAAEAMVAGLLRTCRRRAPDAARLQERGRILVVDDNGSNRDLLARRLAREGHEVIEAESGRRALQLLGVEEIDLILLDLMMPDMNGLEVLDRLKADDRLREIPVIMISGLQETDSVIRCIEAGAEDYLPKPFNPILLRARISACLERKRWHDRERHYLARLEEEKERSDTLIRNILPGQIIGRLSHGEALIADRFDNVTILFCDMVGFTKLASRVTPAQLVNDLNRLFSAFDALTRGFGIEKIKTIGDAYMVAAGLPDARSDHAEVMADMALAMLKALDQLNATGATPFRVRIGMHCGPVVAGIIGTHKFIYDVWGDTVNVASRLEASGLPNRIHVSEHIQRALEHRFEFEPRGLVAIRGRGRMRTAFLTARKSTAPQPLRAAAAYPELTCIDAEQHHAAVPASGLPRDR